MSWVALVFRPHQHHVAAVRWFNGLRDQTAGFCRLTQLGFLRLITHPAVMQEEVRTPRQAWDSYDALGADSRIVFYSEPDLSLLDREFRSLTTRRELSVGQWPDAYIAAFAAAARLQVVTFDRGLSRLAGQTCVLLN